MNRIYNRTRLIFGLFVILSTLLFSATTVSANTKPEDIDEDFEEGDIKQHELFDFEAFIRHGEIQDGTAPFDLNDEPGNDSGEHNGVIRSFDTATYPIKITINPKNTNMLENIKLKITGTLENGITDNRVNAKFAVGGKEDVTSETVSFVQEYTITRTGNSVMIPIALDVMGAADGTVLTPRLSVQVVSVDGQDISNDQVTQVFDRLPSLKVSSKVSIGVWLRNAGSGDVGYLGRYIPETPSDQEPLINKVGLAFYAKNLPGKTDSRGTTIPTGKIDFSIDVSGRVYWDDIRTNVPLNFQGPDDPVRLFDLQSIDWNVGNYIGNQNTVMDGRSYNKGTGYSGVPQSKMSNLSDQSRIEAEKEYKVWDSGQYQVEPTNTDNAAVSRISGSFEDYIIGSTFPSREGAGEVVSVNANMKVFSTRNINFVSPRQYKVGAELNPNNRTNTVYYTVTARIHGYEDQDGVYHNLTEASNQYRYSQRNGIGTMSTNLKFWSQAGAPLGTVARYHGHIPYGDESILRGQNVRSAFHAANSGANMEGGMETIIKWNIDSFELTKTNASSVYIRYLQHRTRAWRSESGLGYNGVITTKLGVPKNRDMSFERYLTYDKQDYDWFDTYEQAIAVGPIGAVSYNIEDGLDTGPTVMTGFVHLKVLTEEIGSLNSNGTPNISTQITYGYYDQARQLVAKASDSGFSSYTKYDENGYITHVQTPIGINVPFDTLGIINGNVTNVLTADKPTYYSTDTMKWQVKSSMVIPNTVSSDATGGSVKVEQILPNGLVYKLNSAKIGTRNVEPQIIQNSDGTTTLVFEVPLATNSNRIDDIMYETVINPLATQHGVRAGFTVNSVISSPIDTRRVTFRRSSATINVIKVGMVGIHETINKTHGDKNSDYKVTLSPYTTIEDELRVAGLTHIPSNSDSLGSNFDGTVELKNIAVSAEREHNDDISIYLNKEFVYDDKPNKIDISKNGWYPFTGKASELKDAKSIHFVVNGLMTNKDDIRIELTIQTQNNNFGNEYMNETVINSATDYKLSPISNRVRYEIRPDWELSMERIEIYTNKKDEGLPVRVRIGQRVLAEPESIVNGYTFDLSIYDTVTKQQVATKKITQSELDTVTDLLIPASALSGIDKGGHRKFEARIENYDDNRVWARAQIIDADGYVSAEKVFKNSDIVNGKVTHGATDFVTMVSYDLRTNIREKLYETFTINDLDIYGDDVGQITKSGYSYQFTGDVVYESSMHNAVDARYKRHFGDENGLKTSTDTHFITSNELLDKTIDLYNEDGSTPIIEPDTNIDTGVNSFHATYDIEKIYIERVTGDTFTESQIGANPPTDKYIDSSIISNPLYEYKNTLYAPIWLKAGDTHNIGFKALDTIGSNRITFDFTGKVKVEASMFSHINSETADQDEIMIHQSQGDHE